MNPGPAMSIFETPSMVPIISTIFTASERGSILNSLAYASDTLVA